MTSNFQAYSRPFVADGPVFSQAAQMDDLQFFVRAFHTIVHFFSSVAYVWVPGAKTTGPIAKKFDFS
jgi:hypothetical protein